MGQLDGKVAVITGAGTGLGAATATLFAAEGAAVTLIGRRETKLKDVAGWIIADGGRALVVAGDVAVPTTASRAAQESISAFGAIDILITTAGIHATPYPLHETPLHESNTLMDVDLTGPFLFSRAVLPSMIQRRDGAIVNNRLDGGARRLQRECSIRRSQGRPGVDDPHDRRRLCGVGHQSKPRLSGRHGARRIRQPHRRAVGPVARIRQSRRAAHCYLAPMCTTSPSSCRPSPDRTEPR